jgi:hypothetical protein
MPTPTTYSCVPCTFRTTPADEQNMRAIEAFLAAAGMHFVRKSDVIRHALARAAMAVQTAPASEPV